MDNQPENPFANDETFADLKTSLGNALYHMQNDLLRRIEVNERRTSALEERVRAVEKSQIHQELVRRLKVTRLALAEIDQQKLVKRATRLRLIGKNLDKCIDLIETVKGA